MLPDVAPSDQFTPEVSPTVDVMVADSVRPDATDVLSPVVDVWPTVAESVADVDAPVVADSVVDVPVVAVCVVDDPVVDVLDVDVPDVEVCDVDDDVVSV